MAISQKSRNDYTGAMDIIPGPDFPTAGQIIGRSGIRKAYETGRGSVLH
ncbi:hypothetical protein ACEQPO_30555 [Bacillus sp. SL00103]